MGKRIELVADVTGVVWQVPGVVGARVASGDAVVIVESMKMEIPVEAPCGGVVAELRCEPNHPVREGDVVAVLEAD